MDQMVGYDKNKYQSGQYYCVCMEWGTMRERSGEWSIKWGKGGAFYYCVYAPPKILTIYIDLNI